MTRMMSELSSLCTTKDTVYGKRDGVVTGLAIVTGTLATCSDLPGALKQELSTR